MRNACIYYSMYNTLTGLCINFYVLTVQHLFARKCLVDFDTQPTRMILYFASYITAYSVPLHPEI